MPPPTKYGGERFSRCYRYMIADDDYRLTIELFFIYYRDISFDFQVSFISRNISR